MSGLVTLGRRVAPARIGGKGAGLTRLIALGQRVPPGVVVPADLALDEARRLLAPLVAEGAWAVRSSAVVEDGAHRSYAGQFLTELDVVGLEDVLAAVERVRASRPAAYDDVPDAAGEPIVHVVVQRQVEAVVAGVAFSRNPLTGLAETIVEAVEGSAAALVSGLVTPERWTSRWGEFSTRPTEARVPETVISDVVATTEAIARREGAVDLEWAWDGTTLWWLQLRPITTIDVPVYSNRISREVLPGLITPLVWSVNIPVVNGAWLDLFTRVIGSNDLTPDRLARRIGCRAYFDMRAVGDVFEALGMPRDLLEVLMGLPGGPDRPSFRPGPGVVRHLPRLLGMALRVARYRRELDRTLPRLRAAFEALAMPPARLAELDDAVLVAGIDRLTVLAREAAFTNILAPLLMNAFGGRYRRALAAAGIDPLTVDPAAGDPTLEALDPGPHLDRLAETYAGLDAATRARVEAGEHDLLPGLDALLERFGHVSESGNDFAVPRWRDRPGSIVASLSERVRAGGAAATRLEHRGDRALARAAARAATWRVARERVSDTYTYGYGLFRPRFLEVGRRLVERGALAAADDVFLLSRDEAIALLVGTDAAPADPATLVAVRRQELEDAAGLELPETVFGDDVVAVRRDRPGGTLQGLATSRGVHRGPARVKRRLDDGGTVRPGEVLVIPYSDVAWTAVLRGASAVVAEAGGMLSHSSIIARELGIPCVVSVDGATRIPAGTTITVDGYGGTVTVETVRGATDGPHDVASPGIDVGDDDVDPGPDEVGPAGADEGRGVGTVPGR